MVDVPHIMQWQAPAAELAEKPGTMNSRTTGQMDKSVPRIVEQIVEVPLTVPQDLVLQRAAVENIAQVSPRGKAMCADFCHRLAPKKRKSIFESGMMDGEPSEHDTCRTVASACEVSRETRGLVQGRECRLEVDETRERGMPQRKAKVLNKICSKWRLTGRPVAHTSRPRKRKSESWNGPESSARSVEWSSSCSDGTGSST